MRWPVEVDFPESTWPMTTMLMWVFSLPIVASCFYYSRYCNFTRNFPLTITNILVIINIWENLFGLDNKTTWFVNNTTIWIVQQLLSQDSQVQSKELDSWIGNWFTLRNCFKKYSSVINTFVYFNILFSFSTDLLAGLFNCSIPHNRLYKSKWPPSWPRVLYYAGRRFVYLYFLTKCSYGLKYLKYFSG